MVAELVGAAGTGKSTLSLRLAGPGVLRASVWKLPRGWWLYNALRSMPTLFALCVRARALPAFTAAVRYRKRERIRTAPNHRGSLCSRSNRRPPARSVPGPAIVP